MNTITKPKVLRKTPTQKKAYDHYRLMCRMEDNYLNSVFVTPKGTEEWDCKRRYAYDECKRLGLTAEHGCRF